MWESPIRQLPIKLEKEEVGEDTYMYGRVDKSQLTAQELREHAAYVEALTQVRAERSNREGWGE